MKKLILSILLFPSLLLAEVIPPGCYVADYYRTNPCWSAFDNITVWNHSGDRSAEVLYYGLTVEAIIHKNFTNLNAYNQCVSDYNNLSNLNNSNVNDFNILVNDYNILASDYDKALKKIKRLKAKIKRLS